MYWFLIKLALKWAKWRTKRAFAAYDRAHTREDRAFRFQQRLEAILNDPPVPN